MNFISTFDELNKLYESAPEVVNKKVNDLCAVMLDGQQIYTGTRQECNDFVKNRSNTAVAKHKKFEIVQGAEVPVIKEASTKKVVYKKVNDLYAVMLDGQQIYAGTRQECNDFVKQRSNTAVAKYKKFEIVQGAEVPVIQEACTKKAFTEAVEDEEIETGDDESATEEIPAEEPITEEEPRQVICECDKCGALVIKDEADIVVDEKTDLVNVEEECQFCEEAKGFKIIGVVAPYEATEKVPAEEPVIEEGLADVGRKIFDKSASWKTQQKWEETIFDLEQELAKETDPNKKMKLKQRIKQLQDKFAQQRDWEKRHPDKASKAPILSNKEAK